MKTIIKPILRLTFLLLVVTPILAWFIVKPVRIIAPELVGLTCYDNQICIDIESEDFNLELAQQLRADAQQFLSEKVSSFTKTPKIIYCSTWQCAKKFGLGDRSAITLGTFGSAISPRAWQDYYIRHELIHQLQAQNMGIIKCLLSPTWLIEGMAYELSEDPRQPLKQPWENHRLKFREWLSSKNLKNLWTEI
ncbi:hypothetical protein MAH1_04980 [Sessilibacter sp. MAH1]